jgi:hypothetical protein
MNGITEYFFNNYNPKVKGLTNQRISFSPDHCVGRSQPSGLVSAARGRTHSVAPSARMLLPATRWISRSTVQIQILLLYLGACADGSALTAFNCSFGGGADGVLSVDTTTGAYSIDIRASSSVLHSLLRGAPPRILRDGQWLAAHAGLELDSTDTISGTDGNGDFVGTSLVWKASEAVRTTRGDGSSDGDGWRWETSFRCYAAGPLVFRQAFPQGSNDTLASASMRHRDWPGSAFPSFSTAGWPESLRLATFYGQNAARTTQLGTFTQAYSGGYKGGPLALFAPALDGAVVLSPLSNFMVAEHNLNATTAELQFGLQGMLASVPAGYATDFVLSAHVPPKQGRGQGQQRGGAVSVEHAGTVAAAFMRWGDALLKAHRGVRTPPDASQWISKLGYSTTGVFHCESTQITMH